MPTFILPATNRTPPFDVDAKGLPRRLFRHFRGEQQVNNNVFILNNGSVVTDTPPATYNTDGSVNQTSEQQIARAFYGTGPYTVTAAEAAILNAAGYPTT